MPGTKPTNGAQSPGCAPFVYLANVFAGCHPLPMTRAALAMLTLALTGCGDDDRAARRAAAGASPDLAALMRVASADAGRRTYRQCAACHTIGRGGQQLAGPNLYGVLGRAVAADASYGYTQALQLVGGRWTPERMDAWLRAPASFAPGTKMAYAGLRDPMARADLIAYLAAQSDRSEINRSVPD